MLTTYKNAKGIIDSITANWPEDQKKRAQEELKKSDNYRPVVDNDAEEYVPKKDR